MRFSFFTSFVIMFLCLNACKKEKCECVFDQWVGNYKRISLESMETFDESNPPPGMPIEIKHVKSEDGK